MAPAKKPAKPAKAAKPAKKTMSRTSVKDIKPAAKDTKVKGGLHVRKAGEKPLE